MSRIRNSKLLESPVIFGAQGGSRIPTLIEHWNLNPACLPVPTPGQEGAFCRVGGRNQPLNCSHDQPLPGVPSIDRPKVHAPDQFIKSGVTSQRVEQRLLRVCLPRTCRPGGGERGDPLATGSRHRTENNLLSGEKHQEKPAAGSGPFTSSARLILELHIQHKTIVVLFRSQVAATLIQKQRATQGNTPGQVVAATEYVALGVGTAAAEIRVGQ